MGHPACGIAGQGFAVERFGVAVHGGLAEGEDGEDEEERQAGCACPGWRSGLTQLVNDGGYGDDDAEAGEVLKVVGHPGKAEGIDVQEAENREEGSDKEEEGCQPGTAAKGDGERGQHTGREEPLPPGGGIEGPARVGEDEAGGPEELGG